MKTLYYFITFVILNVIVGCDNTNETENALETANTRSTTSICDGFSGNCLPNCEIETDDDSGKITLKLTRKSHFNCATFNVDYTGTIDGNHWVTFSYYHNEESIEIQSDQYTKVEIRISCSGHSCHCDEYYTAEAGQEPDDIGPIKTFSNCGREYYTHSFQCQDSKIYIYCDDSEYDKHFPNSNPFKMVIDSYTTRTHIPGHEDDNSDFPKGGTGYRLGDPIDLYNINEGSITYYFYSSQCNHPKQHCYYFSYDYMADVTSMHNIYVHRIYTHTNPN